MAIINLRHVSYRYGTGTPFEKEALDDVSLTIEKGDFACIIGHTGSGKSTLLKLFNGLIRPRSGAVVIDNKNIWDEPAKIRFVRFQVGLVFQYPESQLFEDTVYKDLAYGPQNMDLDTNEIDCRVHDAIRFVGLNESYLNRSPFGLSGGEMRRVAIAGVIAMRPKVLVLDEPTAGLDPEGRELILGQINRYRRETGCTIVLVSHSMEDAAKYAQTLFVLNQGKLVMAGTTEQIFRRSDELSKIGLDIPEMTKLFHLLHAHGLSVSPSIFTVDQAETEIIRLLRNQGVKMNGE